MRSTGAPVTSVPATDVPVAEPTLHIEEIDPDFLQFTDAPGTIILNGSEQPLDWDGGMGTNMPRLQIRDGKVRVSLDDLSACLKHWVLTDEGDSVILEAEGHTLALLNEDAGIVATLDAAEIAVEPGDFEFGNGNFIDAVFLAKALGGSAEWNADRNTLMLDIPAAD